MSLPMFGNFHITVYEVPHWLEFCKPFHYVWYSLWQKKNLFPQRSPSFVLWFVVCWTRFHNLCVQILFKIFFHPGFLFFCLPLTWIVFLIGSPTGVQEKRQYQWNLRQNTKDLRYLMWIILRKEWCEVLKTQSHASGINIGRETQLTYIVFRQNIAAWFFWN